MIVIIWPVKKYKPNANGVPIVIENIANGKSKPSIEEFLYICDYLGVTPSDFFDEQNKRPILIQKAVDGMSSLSDQDILLIISLIDRMKNGSHNP